MRPTAADLTADIVVVGAGPAGAATALMLAPFARTLLVDRLDPATASAGRFVESLPAAAWRLLRDMGLWDDFQRQGHPPCYARRAVWGDGEPQINESLLDADGSGWLIDRARLDTWLRERALARGVALVAPARAAALEAIGEEWRLTLIRRGRHLTLRARWLIEAGGRIAPLARLRGLRRQRGDRLVCRWVSGRSEPGDGMLTVASEPDGWWYSAALPGGRRVLAFHTDADLAAAKATADAGVLLARARAHAGLGSLVGAFSFDPQATTGYCAAQSAWIEEAAAPGWVAVGDAALSCDPLSAQGLFNALYSAFLAAGAVREALAGSAEAVRDYQRAVESMAHGYRAGLGACYGAESRWLHRPFWARRANPLAAAQGGGFPLHAPSHTCCRKS